MAASRSMTSPVRALSSHRFRRVLGTAAALALVTGCGPEGESAETRPVEAVAQEIAGGSNALITASPWMASLQDVDGTHRCGAAVIDASWVLTSRQCVQGATALALKSPTLMRIGAGSATRSTLASAGQLRWVLDVIPFPGYVGAQQGKDVVLLRLSSALTLNDTTLKAIPLVTAADEAAGLTAPGVTATLTGWGMFTAGSGVLKDALQKMDVPIVTNLSASMSHGMAISADQLPTFIPNSFRFFCPGDIGGPLVVNGPSGKLLAGVASWTTAASCMRPTAPEMYARVASFQPWISDLLGRTPGVLLNNPVVSVPQGTWKHSTVTVPAGTLALNVSLANGSGDGNLYVHTTQPTTTVYTCRSNSGNVTNGNAEYCSVPNPAAGTWYVSVYGAGSVSNTALRVTAY